MRDEDAHILARKIAADLREPDKKHLRFNDIVRVARAFYGDMAQGIRELVTACDKAEPSLHNGKKPMWQALEEDYGWMRNGSRQ